MKFRLPRQILSEEIRVVIVREIKKQKLSVLRASKKDMEEIAQVSCAIERSGLPANLVCKKLPSPLGYGIFLHPKAKPILKGQVIAPYSGEVSISAQNLADDSAYAFSPLYNFHLSKEEQAYFDSNSLYRPNRLYTLNVEALKKGNFTRFINHSEKPNIIAHFFNIPENSYGLEKSPLEVVYVASKTIRPGEQLLVNYEGDDESYWSAFGIKPVLITPTTFKLTLNGQIQ